MGPKIPRPYDQAPRSSDFLDDFVSETDYAARRGVSVRTCQRDRQLRQAPPYVRFGRRIYYRIDAVREWLVKNEQAADRPRGAVRRWAPRMNASIPGRRRPQLPLPKCDTAAVSDLPTEFRATQRREEGR